MRRSRFVEVNYVPVNTMSDHEHNYEQNYEEHDEEHDLNSRTDTNKGSTCSSRGRRSFWIGITVLLLVSGVVVFSIVGETHLMNVKTQQQPVVDSELMETKLLMREMEKKVTQMLDYVQRKVSPLVDNLPNFALESQGASLIKDLRSNNYDWLPWWLPVKYVTNSPRIVIQAHSLPLVPGECWSFAGDRGHLTISLSHPVAITHVSLGHITKDQSPSHSISGAPRSFSVYGMSTLDGGDMTLLQDFTYDDNGDSIQTFEVVGHEEKVFKYVKLQIESNWGDPTYTCLYSFRVHGKRSPVIEA
ncbi:SUN domain-containing protein 3-like [Antennarius striatus]|uniref:SUN domain-containing protein 3-like n=1 Tax=Antennarius striatus TaxID=241820 RepID=UPI0035B4C789